MKIRARPCSRCRSRSRFRYWAWMVRSRLVVGSSAISRRGAQEMPMAPTMRWRMPPDIWCGYCAHPRLGRRDAHRPQQLARRGCQAPAGRPPRAPGSARRPGRRSRTAGSARPSGPAGSSRCACRGRAASPRPTSLSRSSPSNIIRPPTMRAAGGSRRRMVSASVLLPEPDSPTMPSVSPASGAATRRRPRAPPACPAPRRNGWRGSRARAAGGLSPTAPARSAHSWRS